MDKTISVVIPAFNASSSIERALQSVVNQTVQVHDVVLVDDGSTDDTSSILTAWQNRLPLRVFRHEQNQGIARSLVHGVEQARGTLILRLDADDEWLSNHAAAIVGLAASNPDAVLFCTRAEFVDAHGKRLSRSQQIYDHDVRRKLMWDNPFVHSAMGFRKRAYELVGGYPVGVLWEDYRLWIRLAAIGRVCGAAELGVRYHVKQGSLSRQHRRVALQDRSHCQSLALSSFISIHPFVGSVLAPLVRVRAILNL